MEFVLIRANIHAMKKLLIIVLAAVSISSSDAAGEYGSSDRDSRNARKLAKQEKIKDAVESKSFAIELDRLYMSRYGNVNLTPSRNYIIVKGNNAAISAGYVGRQRGLTAIAGIRLTGKPSVYKVQKNDSKGNYRIEMEITKDNDTFHISMTISENGNCSALISGVKIDDTRYSGSLIPIESQKIAPEPDAIKISYNNQPF